jgi:spermidine/putrescine transport system permease protein
VRRSLGRAVQISPASIYYVAMFGVPLLLLTAYSFYSVENFDPVAVFTLDNYVQAFTGEVFRGFYLRTFRIALTVAVLVTAISFAFAFVLHYVLPHRRRLLYFLVLVSLFGGYIVRVYAWRNIMGKQGIINQTLEQLGLIDGPLTLFLNSELAVVIALVNYLIPFGVLPIYAAMQNIPGGQIEAAMDLGAGRLRAAFAVVLPLTSRGCVSAFSICFIATAAEWVTPQLLGGTGDQMIGNQIQYQFGGGLNWPLGAALALSLVLMVSALIGTLYICLRRWLR